MYAKFKRHLGLCPENEFQSELDVLFYNEMQRYYKLFHSVVLFYETVILIAISARKGGPFLLPRRRVYFFLYLTLIAATVLVILFHKWYESNRKSQENNSKIHLRAEHIYMTFFTFWILVLTLNDHLGGNGLTAYSFALLTVAFSSGMKPWQNYLLLISNFVLLNLLLPYFPWPNGLNQSFSDLMNSLLAVSASIALSNYFYKSRRALISNQIVVKRQYEQIQKINHKLSKEIMVDALTQLYNRRYLERTIPEKFSQVQQNGQAMACMMMDIDCFKKFNDLHGHPAGDSLLIQLAAYLKSQPALQQADVIRYGGEEFAVFLYEEQAKNAAKTAKVLQQEIGLQNFSFKNNHSFQISVSIGVCVENPVDPEMNQVGYMLSCADLALYEAKRSGRNRTVLYDNNRLAYAAEQ